MTALDRAALDAREDLLELIARPRSHMKRKSLATRAGSNNLKCFFARVVSKLELKLLSPSTAHDICKPMSKLAA